MFILHFMIYNIHKFLLNNFIIIYYIISLKRAFLLQNALAKFQILLILYNIFLEPQNTKQYSPVCRRYSRLFSSTGKNPTVAPYSGHILEMVARSAMESWETPGPKNSTNFPTTPICRRCYNKTVSNVSLFTEYR